MNCLISDGGHTSRVINSRKNEPSYVDLAIIEGFTVIIDTWVTENNIWLGTDKPTYQISIEWLVKRVNNLIIRVGDDRSMELLSELPQNFNIIYR